MYFQHPEFLIGLFAMLIPLVIHLFNFRRHKKVYFSQVALLKQVTTETKKQRNLLHRIILALRMLAIFFIVMAMAKPVFKPAEKQQALASGEKSIYIDNSFSMMSEGNQGRLFNNAIHDALLLINSSTQSDQFIIKENGTPHLFGKNLNREEAAQKVAEIQISPLVRPLAEMTMANPSSENQTDGMQEFVVFSDFQKNTANIQDIPADSNTRYLLFPLQSIRQDNLVIDSLWFTEPLLIPGRKSTCSVRIKNNATSDFEKIPVTLTINGQQKAVAGIDLAANTSIDISMSYTPETSGWKYGEVKIEDYPITFDDQLFFTINVVPHINILAISDNGISPMLGQLFGSDSLFSLQQESARQINYNKFGQYSLIIINGLTEITSGLTSQLVQFMEQGGHVLLISGNNLAEDRLLKETKCGTLVAVDTAMTRVSSIKLSSPLFKNSIASIPKNADLPVLMNHTHYIFPVQSGVESLVTLLNGDDLLARKQVGKGQLYLLSSGLNRNSGTLATNLLFVPMVAGIALMSGAPETYYFTIGDDEQLQIKTENKLVNEQHLTLLKVGTGESFIPEQFNQKGELQLSLHGNIHTSGYYNLMLNNDIISALAFNYSRQESDLSCYTPRQIDSLCQLAGLPHYRIIVSNDAGYTEVINSLQKESPVWKLFIIFALLALLAEGLLLRLWNKQSKKTV